jgi:hypothetical protein
VIKVDVCRMFDEDGTSGRYLGTVELDEAPKLGDIINVEFKITKSEVGNISRWRVVTREWFARKLGCKDQPLSYIQTDRNLGVGVVPANLDDRNESDNEIMRKFVGKGWI